MSRRSFKWRSPSSRSSECSPSTERSTALAWPACSSSGSPVHRSRTAAGSAKITIGTSSRGIRSVNALP